MKLFKDSLSRQAFGMIIGLIVQYLLGMATTFFVSFPQSGSASIMWKSASSQVLFILHMIWGFLLLLNGVVLYIRAFIQKDKNWKISGGIGLGFIIFAIIAGIEFVGSQKDQYSFVMATAFLIAFLSYVWGLFASR